MPTDNNFVEVEGIAAMAPLTSGNPANLPSLVPGVDQTRNRVHVGGNDKSREFRLWADKTVTLGANPVVEPLPANPVQGQRYGIRFMGMPSEHDVTIDGNGTAFNVLSSDGQAYETQCKWDLPLRNSEAWFECVMGADGQLKWEHE